MNEKFYMILTNIGLAKFANAQVTETNVTFTQIAVGDSNGAYYNPTASMTALVHEVWRGNINAIYIDENNPNWVVCEGIIPTDVGGFMVREMGLFDDENNLLAVGKVPETYKPLLTNGSAKDLYLKAILEVSNANAVTLKIDPAVTVASRKYVDDKIQIVSTNLANVQQQLATHLDNYTQYFVRARSTLTQSIPSASWTDLVFNMYDNTHEGMFTPSSTSTTITIIEDGVYLIVGNISYQISATQGIAGLRVFLNNTDSLASVVNYLPQDRPVDINVTALVSLKAGDTLKLQAYQTSGVALNSVVGSKSVPQFTVKKVG
ncbi:phage tail protein [Metasolibacillus sp. FSL H7-0170]|uniref:phage tail protein n=1 Tax=Metasolibacillus sp. FSL H7-0170 TaxID=2921431 RepID=UPI00315937E0